MIERFSTRTSRPQKIFLIFIVLFMIFVTIKVIGSLQTKRKLSESLHELKNYSPEEISTLISSQYNDAIKLLINELETWDKNFLITMVDISFGSKFEDLKRMYTTGVIRPFILIWLYSPTHRTTRMYQIDSKRIRQRGKEQDWSMADNKERDWPSNIRLPSFDINFAVKKCMEYADQKGNYYLRNCIEGIDNSGGKRFGWSCEFLQVDQAVKTKYLFEFDIKTEGSYQCYFDSRTQEVEKWLRSFPPPGGP